MRRSIFISTAAIMAFLVMVGFNLGANLLRLNGSTTGDVSDRVLTLVTPVGFIFSIWPLIYLWLGAFVIYQALPKQRENRHIQQILLWFILSCATNGLWVLLWHYEYFALTVISMLLLLTSLIIIYIRLGKARNTARRIDIALLHMPFSVYLAWVCISTVANISVWLTYINWDGFGLDPRQWAALIGFLVMLLTLAIVILRNDWSFGLVVLWAYLGIWLNHDNNTWLAYSIAVFGIITAFFTLTRLVTTLLWSEENPLLSVVRVD